MIASLQCFVRNNVSYLSATYVRLLEEQLQNMVDLFPITSSFGKIHAKLYFYRPC
jgi:hypothetical protein